MALSVAGKTAIVTGAGSGINFCFAKLLLEKKCNVVIADLSLRLEARDLIAQYESRTLGQAQAVFQKTDVRDWAQLDQAFNVAQSEFGGADIVCPGAGVFEPVSLYIGILQQLTMLIEW
jgi:3-hydroxybutyrate dehydrogenase